MNKNKLNLIIGTLLLIDAIGSIIVQYQDAFFPFHVGRLFRIAVGGFMLLDYPVQKRVFDLAVASGGLLLALPLFIIIPVVIILESGLPVFFKMERCGKGHRRFVLWHFRSMRNGKNAVSNFKEDGRVTPFGKYIRATGLDSLPELVNVIKGDISIVGPRPMPFMVEDEPQYKTIEDVPGYFKRSTVVPGLTGIAQVHSSKYVSRRIRYRYDNLYVNKVSLWMDIKLFVYSFWVALKKGWD